MDDINKKTKEELMRDLKPTGAYLGSLTDFADLLGTIRQAENAAKELLNETSSAAGLLTNVPPAAGSQPGKKVANSAAESGSSDEPETEQEEAAEPEKTLEELLDTLDELVISDSPGVTVDD